MSKKWTRTLETITVVPITIAVVYALGLLDPGYRPNYWMAIAGSLFIRALILSLDHD